MKTFLGGFESFASSFPCRSEVVVDARFWESWDVPPEQLGALILDSLFPTTSTWSCFYSLISNSWNLFGNILGFWNGKEKLLRALRAATGTCYLAGSNPKWQPQPRFSQVLFEEFRALFSIHELYLCFVCACETVELQGLVRGCGAFGWEVPAHSWPPVPSMGSSWSHWDSYWGECPIPRGWAEIRAAVAESLSPQGGACRQIGSVWL